MSCKNRVERRKIKESFFRVIVFSFALNEHRNNYYALLYILIACADIFLLPFNIFGLKSEIFLI